MKQLINRQRNKLTVSAAKTLFDIIVETAVAKPESSSYTFDVFWADRQGELDDLIFEKVRVLFLEMNADLRLKRKDNDYVSVSLVPEVAVEEEFVSRFFWSRKLGNFVNKKTGAPSNLPYEFSGTVHEWYETLVETCIDCSNLMKKQLGVAPSVLYTGTGAGCILEATILYKPTDDSGVGKLPYWTVLTDPNLSSNTIKLIAIKDGKRMVGEVVVLDLDLI